MGCSAVNGVMQSQAPVGLEVLSLKMQSNDACICPRFGNEMRVRPLKGPCGRAVREAHAGCGGLRRARSARLARHRDGRLSRPGGYAPPGV